METQSTLNVSIFLLGVDVLIDPPNRNVGASIDSSGIVF